MPAPKIIDASHYDDLQDIAKVKDAGIRGWINKATEGPGMVDKTFAIRRPVVLGAGLKYGAYHFLRPGDQEAHAAHYLNTIGDVTGLELAGDWEDTAVKPNEAWQWFATIHSKTGHWPLCYSYSAMLMEFFGHQPNALFAQTRLWVARYDDAPYWPQQIWPKWWAWQYTDGKNGPSPHQIPGIILPGQPGIDINAFNGTDDELLTQWAA